MSKLLKMHESLSSPRLTVPNSSLPVSPREVPLTPSNRWLLLDKRVLLKQYSFDDFDTRNAFVAEMFTHESELGHRADVQAHTDDKGKPQVTLRLTTPGVDVITELDREFAKFADVVYRDLTYNLKHGRLSL